MRGTVAKRLRKEARKTSKPTTQKIKWYKRTLKKTDDEGKIKDVVDYRGTVICAGYRRAYQDLKRSYKKKPENS